MRIRIPNTAFFLSKSWYSFAANIDYFLDISGFKARDLPKQAGALPAQTLILVLSHTSGVLSHPSLSEVATHNPRPIQRSPSTQPPISQYLATHLPHLAARLSELVTHLFVQYLVTHMLHWRCYLHLLSWEARTKLKCSVVDPDPDLYDSYVFGPPGIRIRIRQSQERIRLRILHHQAKIVRKTLISTVL